MFVYSISLQRLGCGKVQCFKLFSPLAIHLSLPESALVKTVYISLNPRKPKTNYMFNVYVYMCSLCKLESQENIISLSLQYMLSHSVSAHFTLSLCLVMCKCFHKLQCVLTHTLKRVWACMSCQESTFVRK